MLGTVTVGLFDRQLVSRVSTTAGQDSPRGRGAASGWLSQAHVRVLSDDPVDARFLLLASSLERPVTARPRSVLRLLNLNASDVWLGRSPRLLEI